MCWLPAAWRTEARAEELAAAAQTMTMLALLVLALLAFAAVLLVLVRSRAWMTDALYGSILVSLTVYGTMAGYLNIHGNKLDDAWQQTRTSEVCLL